MKLKREHIFVKNTSKLHIYPYDKSKEKMFFVMQSIKMMLPNVIVKGIPSINRAVINKQQKDESKFELLVEGYGLKQVMMTPGVDFAQTLTNHIIETEEVLGIEAAR